MKIRIVTICLVGLVLAAEPPADLVKKEKQKLEGTWIMTAVEVEGKPVEQGPKDAKIIFAGDKVTIETGDMKEEGAYTLDPTKTPKHIDFVMTGKGTMKNIYQLEGEVLKMCVAGNSQKVVNGKVVEEKEVERPERMDSKNVPLMTFKREKK